MRRRALLAGGAALLSLTGGRLVFGRTSNVLPYPFAEVWPTAVRFLRVDRGAVIREKDPEAGYVLFELTEAGKTWKGALELVRSVDGEGREATRVVFTLNDLPRHYEIALYDKLALKVREEHGSPAPAPPRPSEPAERPRQRPDGGALPRPPTRDDLPRPSGGG